MSTAARNSKSSARESDLRFHAGKNERANWGTPQAIAGQVGRIESSKRIGSLSHVKSYHVFVR